MKGLRIRRSREDSIMKEVKNNRGFSLVELIIAIAIMAILVGIVAVQLIVSCLWARRYARGPAESLWRIATWRPFAQKR